MAFIETFIDPSQIPFISTFLLVFAIVFGLLTYSTFMKLDKRVNALIALAVAMFSVFYEPLVVSLNQFMPIVVIVLIVLFFVAFIKKIFEEKESKDKFPMVITIGILLLVLGVIGDRLAPFIPAGVDPTAVFWIIGLVFVLLFFWAAYKHPERQ